MSIIHSASRRPFDRPAGECRWRHYHEDVVLWCGDNAIPGGDLCADHLIQRCQAPGFVPSLPERRLQQFPSRLVDVDPPVISSKEQADA